MNPPITLKRTNSLDADFPPLIKLLDADLNLRYEELMLTYNAFNIIPYIDTVIIAYQNNKPVGCGCFKVFDSTTVEIKRMFVHPDVRGLGVAAAILRELETWAGSLGYQYSILEFGDKQPEATRLYQKLDYKITDNYGPYIGIEHSTCMRKSL